MGQVHQSCQKWKKSEKLFGSYRVNKTLWPAGAYEPVQKHSHPSIPGWLNGEFYCWKQIWGMTMLCKSLPMQFSNTGHGIPLTLPHELGRPTAMAFVHTLFGESSHACRYKDVKKDMTTAALICMTSCVTKACSGSLVTIAEIGTTGANLETMKLFSLEQWEWPLDLWLADFGDYCQQHRCFPPPWCVPLPQHCYTSGGALRVWDISFFGFTLLNILHFFQVLLY